MDQVRARTLLDQTPNLERLTVDGLRSADSNRHPIKTTMDRLHTIGFRVTDLNRCPYPYLEWASAIQLPALHKHMLIDMPDTILSEVWSDFVSAIRQKVDEVEVKAIVPVAGQRALLLAYLVHLCTLLALTSLHLVGDCARLILGAMAFQPISRGTQRPTISGVTRVHVGDYTLLKRMLRVCGWSVRFP